MDMSIPQPMGDSAEFERYQKRIGINLREARIKAGFATPNDLAAKLENVTVTGGAIGRMENGESTANFAKLTEYCRALNTTPNKILEFPDPPPPPRPPAPEGEIDDERLRALLEGVLIGIGTPPEEARLLGPAFLRVLRRPQLDSAGNPQGSPQEVGHTLATIYIQRLRP